MNDQTRIFISENAQAIAEFKKLPIDQQRKFFPLLSPSVQSCLEIIEYCENNPCTYQELSQELGQAKNTVIQKVLALVEGGLSLDVRKAAFVSVGRPRNLIKR